MSVNYPSYMNTDSRYSRSVDYWSPEITGEWGADTARGKGYADEAVACIKRHNNPTAFGHVIKAMIGKGSWSGVEVGFFHRFCEHLIGESPEWIDEGGTERPEPSGSSAVAID